MTVNNKRKVGMYGGKFIPFHNGHLYSILKAASIVDHLYVIVSYVEERDKTLCKNANLPYIDYKQRELWINQAVKDLTNVTVLSVEDVPMEGNENNLDYVWGEGARRIKEAVQEEITHIFSSESEYDKWWRKYYSQDIEHIIIDEARSLFPVSATKIRTEGVFNCWDMIPDVCKPFYTKRVVLLGIESVGKSTLIRNLAKLFNTNYVEEYGRTVTEKLGNGSSLLNEHHYQEIVYGHKYKENQAIEESNKLLFVDTEAIVTQYYSKLYLGKELEFIDGVIAAQNYDLYIYLEPDVKFVDDGYRTHPDEEDRRKNNELLKSMLKERNVSFVSVHGNYQERLDKCIELIVPLLKQ